MIDGHFDLPTEVWVRRKKGEKDVIKNRHLSIFKEAEVKLIIASVFLYNENVENDNPYLVAKEIIHDFLMDMDTVKEDVMLIKTQNDLESLENSHKTGMLLYLEGLEPVAHDIDALEEFYELGVRGAALTWSRRNVFATGSNSKNKNADTCGEITELGKKVLQKMEKLGMFVDCSHLNAQGTDSLKNLLHVPYVATHSNAAALCRHPRNLEDYQIEDLAKMGGIIGLNAYSEFVAPDTAGHPIERLCDQIEYLLKKAGEDHVGLGLDLCRFLDLAEGIKEEEIVHPDCLRDYREIRKIKKELHNRGISGKTIYKIMEGNWIRVLGQFLPVKL